MRIPCPNASSMCAGAEGTQDKETALEFLQGMFPTMDAGLVRDVMHSVQDDSAKACDQLLDIQVGTLQL